jgi:hypothetical protein
MNLGDSEACNCIGLIYESGINDENEDMNNYSLATKYY